MRRCGEGGIDRGAVAGPPVETEISRRLSRDLRRHRGAGGGGGGHRRQRGIVDNHGLGGVERLVAGIGDDQRHRLAGIADLAFGQQRLRRKGEALAGLGIGLGGRAQRQQPIGGGIGGGQHRQHPRHRLRRLRFNSIDPRMRVRRAQHHRMRQAGKGEIVEIGPAAGKEAHILPSFGFVADAGANRRHPILLLPVRPRAGPAPRRKGTASKGTGDTARIMIL